MYIYLLASVKLYHYAMTEMTKLKKLFQDRIAITTATLLVSKSLLRSSIRIFK